MRPVANRLIGLLALSAAILGTRAPRALAQTSQESEPNNSPATADSTALGLFMSGYINIAGDTDYYFIDLTGGTDVAFRVDAARYGGPLNSVMGLLDRDGRTLLAVNDDGNDDYVTDSRIWYHVPASGRYYVFVTSADGRGGSNYDYDLSARTYTPEPPGPTPTEREPNNSIATASPASLGDTVIGVLNPHGDIDYYGFDLTAGTKLKIAVLARHVCLFFTLTPPAGASVWAGCERSDTLVYLARATGRYTLRIEPYDFTPGHAGLGNWYAVKIGTYKAPDPGPGNPTTVFASAFTSAEWWKARITGTAADRSGGLYAATDDGVSHVSASGDVTPLASGVYSGFGAMAVDGFGDLLLAGYELDSPYGPSHGVVWRFTPSGQQSRFAAAPGDPSIMFSGIAIGPDGDVWFADAGMQKDSKIWRYDPLGNLKAKIDVSATGRAWNLAMSPRGELYFVTQDGGIYKLIGNSPQLVGHAKTTQWGNPIAFDRDGYAYLLDDSHGKVMLFDPQFHLATDPFAQVLDSLGWSAEWTSAGPAFLREQGGGMTRRVVVARYDTTHGAIVELNDDAVRAPGADITPRLERVQLAAGRAATVGSSYVDTLWMPGGTTTWEIIAGHLPRGISLNSQTGVLSGSPAEIGVFDFSVRAKSGSVTGYGRFSLSVTAALSVTDVANALLGGTPLPDAVVQFLDQQGNRNGSLDVGDLRAYLRAQNTPSVTAPNPLGAAVHSRAMTQQESDRLRALLIRGTR